MGDLNGVYKRPYNWTNDSVTDGTNPGKFDQDGDQVAAALNNRIFADGSGANVSADIPMAGHSFTGLRPGAAVGEPATFDQISSALNDLDFLFCASLAL